MKSNSTTSVFEVRLRGLVPVEFEDHVYADTAAEAVNIAIKAHKARLAEVLEVTLLAEGVEIN